MGVSQYTLELMAKVVADAGKIQKDIDNITSKINAKINLDVSGGTTIADVQKRFENIRNTADKLAQLTATSRDGLGNVNQYSLKYMDEAKNKYNEIWKLEEKVDATGKKSSEWKLTEQKAIDGILVREKERLKLEKDLEKSKEKQNLLDVKILEGMDAQSKKAESFLAKYEFMTPSPQGDKLKQLAEGIKSAASSGNVQQVNKLSREFDILKGTLSAASGESYNIGKEMGAVIRRTLESAATLGLMYGALNQLRQGIQYIKDLDKELTNVQVVTGMSQDSVEELAMGYNGLAKEMGVTTLEVAKGSLEFLRQGKSVKEAGELVKTTMVLSKLGNIEAAQATEYLTSTMNGFKLEAKDSMSIVDKIISLDNNFATSSAEIASALQRSSVSAQQAGVSFEELASMITVVSDVSRRAPESIGESYKTIFARYQDILQGGVDEEGMGINNVGKALERVGINIRDAEGGFRDFGDVLDDLYPKWGSLNEIEQANILKALAGTRQRESLLVLLENEEKYRKALTVQIDAEGKALERYGEYLDGVEASQNKMKATWEEFWQKSIDSGVITNFYNAISSLISGLGSLERVLGIVIPLIILFNASLIKTQLLSVGNMFSGLLAGLQALIPAFGTATVVAEGTAGAWMAANIAALPFILTIGAISTALYLGIKVINDYKKAQDELLETLKKTSSEISASSYDEYVEKRKKEIEKAGYTLGDDGKVYKEGYHGMMTYVNGLDLMSESMWNAVNSVDEGERKIESFDKSIMDGLPIVESAKNAYTGLAETMKALSDTSTEELIQKSISGELGFEDIEKIPEEYLSALDVVNGKLKLNIDTVKELQLAEAEQALQSAKNAGAKQSEIDVIQLYYDQLLQESQNTFGAFSQTAWQYDELLWTISNDAVAAGFSFVDLEGNALNSAESIHSFLASSDQAFNSFVQQAAIATGRSAQEIMNLINGMVAETYNNTVSMINSLGGMVGGLSPDERDEAKARGMNLPKIKQVTPVGGALFGGKTPSYSGKGSGGSSKDDSATKEAERLREIEKEISDARNDATKSLKNQLKIYKQMVDEREKLLDTMKEERSYQQDLEEKQNNVADIQNQIAELSLDDSAEAQAQVLALQDQLTDAQQELGNLEFEHGIDQQQTALDNELSRVENLVENAIMAIEEIDASSLASFTSQLSTILAGLGSAVPQFHTGGIVGGRYESRENEQFAKLLNKELVVTPDQMSNFMSKTLPTIMSGTPSVSSTLQGMEIGQLMNFNINGGLDKSVLPSIEKIANMVVDKLNDNMLIRGTKRGAGLFSA